MMAAKTMTGSLMDRLPEVGGRYTRNAPLDKITWFKVGGPAEVMFRPLDADDLALFLSERPADVSVTVIGVGSNLLVRDGGVPGVVVRLGRGFANIETDGTDVIAGAGALDANVALAARDAAITGLEFLSGVPGTVGGALRMNAGAYGVEMKDVTVGARGLDSGGAFHDLTPGDLGFGYRSSAVPADWIFISARLMGAPGDPGRIAERMAGIKSEREATQPHHTPTGGSTFANPTGKKAGKKAWELIAAAGCRGLRHGGAQVSEKHCNFLINTGGATAADLEGLGEEVRRRVFADSGVTLEWEIRRIGVPSQASLKEVPAGEIDQ